MWYWRSPVRGASAWVNPVKAVAPSCVLALGLSRSNAREYTPHARSWAAFARHAHQRETRQHRLRAVPLLVRCVLIHGLAPRIVAEAPAGERGCREHQASEEEESGHHEATTIRSVRGGRRAQLDPC